MLYNFWKTNYSHKCNFNAMNKWDHNPIYFFAFWNCSCISYTNTISPLFHGVSNSIYQYFYTQYADFIRTIGNSWINLRVYMCICITCRWPGYPERGITIYLQFCSFELELSILQQGVVFLLTVFELMLFEFVWCYFLWRYLKIHGMEIESYCKIKHFLKRLQIALQIRILYFSTNHKTNNDMISIQYER